MGRGSLYLLRLLVGEPFFHKLVASEEGERKPVRLNAARNQRQVPTIMQRSVSPSCVRHVRNAD